MPQLHHLVFSGPGQKQQQLTFDDEPSVNAVRLRRGDPDCSEIIYSQDEGGDEYYTYHHLDTRNGVSTPMAGPLDGKLKNSAVPCLSSDGTLLAYSTTRRNGKDNDIYMVDMKSSQSGFQGLLGQSQLLMCNMRNAPNCAPIAWSSVRNNHLNLQLVTHNL